MVYALVGASFLAGASPAAAQLGEDAPNYLDRSFGGNGMQVLPQELTPFDVQLDSESRILVSGADADGENPILLRFNSEMTLDPEFGEDGSIELPRTDVEVRVLPDDSLMTLSRGGGGWVRTDFAEDGTTTGETQFAAPSSDGGSAALTPVGGLWAFRKEGRLLVLRRYLPSGAEDLTFSPLTFSAGECSLQGSCFSAYPSDLATNQAGVLTLTTLRFNSRGGTSTYELSSLAPGDTELSPLGRFGAQGYTHFDPLAFDPAGGVLATGTAGPPERAHFIRGLPTGAPDPGFAGDGQRSIALPSSPNVWDISAPGFDDELGFYFTTVTGAYADWPFGLRHFFPNGTYDEAFEQASERIDFQREGTGQLQPIESVVDDAGRVLLIGSVDDGGSQSCGCKVDLRGA